MKKVALITGAAKGIGLATARKFAAEGFEVICTYHNTPVEGFASIRADISVENDINALFAEIGEIDVLVNNAAISSAKRKVEELSFAELDLMFRTNCYSVFLLCKAAIAKMKNRGGSIVNVSSEAAKFGGFQMAHYAASKAAVNTLTIALAREVAEYNIRVNAVSPAIIATDANAQISTEKLQSLPFGRMGTPEEVADAIFYLASDAAKYVSGAILPVTGAR